MGKRRIMKLQHIKHDRKLTLKEDAAFLHQLEIGLLLVLQEDGTLTPEQYHRAVQLLGELRRGCP